MAEFSHRLGQKLPLFSGGGLQCLRALQRMGEDIGNNELGRLAELEARVEHEFAQLAPAREASDAAHG